MAVENAAVFQRVQIGLETTPGTAVPANKELSALGIDPAVEATADLFTPMGKKFPTISALGKEWASAALTGLATYTEMIYPLSSVLGNAAVAGTGPYTWQFSPKTGQPDNYKTFTVEQGTYVRAKRMTGMAISEFGINFTRDKVELSGTAIGRAIVEGIQLTSNQTTTIAKTGTVTSGNYTITVGSSTTASILYSANAAAIQTALVAAVPNATPQDFIVTDVGGGVGAGGTTTIQFTGQFQQQTVTCTINSTGLVGGGTYTPTVTTPATQPTGIALHPVLPTQVNVYLDPTAAALGTTQLHRILSVDFKISNRYGPVWVLDSTQSSYVNLVELVPTCEMVIKAEVDNEGMAFLSDLRTGTSEFIRVQGVGVGNDKLQLDFAGKVKQAGKFSDEEGVYAAEWTISNIYDTTYAKSMNVTLINDIAAL